jgi:hypothetical protein
MQFMGPKKVSRRSHSFGIRNERLLMKPTYPSWLSKNRSASIAAMQPLPAAVIAWR